jgi:BolA protein
MTTTAGTVAEGIKRKIEKAFSPSVLELRDDSGRHAGHAGASPEGETHFHLSLVADAFTGMGRVARQRAVYAVLAEEMAGRVHALALDIKAPGEA